MDAEVARRSCAFARLKGPIGAGQWEFGYDDAYGAPGYDVRCAGLGLFGGYGDGGQTVPGADVVVPELLSTYGSSRSSHHGRAVNADLDHPAAFLIVTEEVGVEIVQKRVRSRGVDDDVRALGIHSEKLVFELVVRNVAKQRSARRELVKLLIGAGTDDVVTPSLFDAVGVGRHQLVLQSPIRGIEPLRNGPCT